MQHALALARKGIGLASPNPMVGCVIVREGQIVGEGFHQYEWREHAEIVALKSAGDKARGATLYVTLEPCNHTGRTGPCSEAIIAAGVQRVVAAIDDPNPLNSGRGFERLRAAGIEVFTGVCEEEARRLNEAFACWIRTKKPFVTLKSAMTLDGQLALPRPEKKSGKSSSKRRIWITSEESRAEVHRKRLLRVVLDSKLRLSLNSRIVKTSDDDMLVFTALPLISPKARKLQNAGAEVIRAKNKNGRIDLAAVVAELGRREILNVLLEAGPTLNGAALAADIVHKLFLFYAPQIAGDNQVPFALAPKLLLPPLQHQNVKQFGPDFAIEGYLQDVYRNH